MRYGIFSDIHSNLEALEAVIGAYKQECVDRYLCLGDIVGYAANPRECIERTKALSAVNVAGNHDWAAVNLFSLDYFNPRASESIVWTQQHIFDNDRHFLESLKLTYQNEHVTLVHATLDEPQDFSYLVDNNRAGNTFKLLATNICFLGHTHVAGIFTQNGNGRIDYQVAGCVDIKEGHKYVVNVGSVGQPRDGDPRAAYCVYDTDKRKIQIKRIDYDIETARQKIIRGGLPTFLGDRLTAGR
jgi:predicted phosphodiesterase